MGIFNKKRDLEIISPVDGIVIKVEEIHDDIFSQKMLGDGFAIIPKVTSSPATFVAPIAGELITVFPTGHAYGIKSKTGVEILVHIGIETVELKGEGFEVLVKQGEYISENTPLVKVDLELIKSKKEYNLDTPVLFTMDSLKNKEIKLLDKKEVKAGEVVAIVS